MAGGIHARGRGLREWIRDDIDHSDESHDQYHHDRTDHDDRHHHNNYRGDYHHRSGGAANQGRGRCQD